MNTNPDRPLQSRWSSLSLHQQRKFIFAIPVVCLLTSLATFSWLEFKTARTEGWVQHTQQVRLEAQRLIAALLNAETEVRGYGLTRRPEFMDRQASAIISVTHSLEQLEQLVADNPSQTQQLQQIRTLAQARLNFLQINLKLLRDLPANVTPPPQLTSRLLEGKRLGDRTMAQIEQFLAEEERLQAERNDQLSQQRRLTWLVLSLSVGIGVGGSLLATYLLNRLEQRLVERDRNLRESEARYRQLVELCPDGIFIQSQGKFALVNRAAVRLFGATEAEELLGKSIFDVLHPNYREIVRERIRQLEADQVAVPLIEEKWFRLDGTFFDAEVAAIPFTYENRPSAQIVIRDITDRKRSEEQLRQVNRSLRTLSECNQALVRVTDEATLLHDICRIVVEFGGYCSAWIAFAEQDEAKSVRPVAQVGYEAGFLQSLQISWADTELGRGPTGTAIRTGQPCFVQNIYTDPRYLPWRGVAVERGYASSIALPLIVEGKPLGALNIYATEPNAFDESEVKLLTELANDLAYGITALRTQIEHQRTEAALRESKQRLDSILNSIEDVVWSVSATTYDVLYLSPATEKVYGRPVQAFFDNPNLWVEVVHPDDSERVKAFNQFLLEQGTLAMEYRIFCPSGEVRWLYDRGRVTYDESGTPIRMDGIVTDITARKHTEEALRQSEERFRAMFERTNAVKLLIEPESGAIVDANPAASRYYGYSHSELITKTIHNISTLLPEQVNAEIRQAKLEERNYFLFRHQLASGEIRDVQVYSSPIEIQGCILLLSIIQDITERQQAEELLRDSETKFRTFLEMASEAIIVTNADSEIVIFNAKAQDLFGYEPAEVLGHRVEFLMPERFHQRHIAHRVGYREQPTKRSMSKTKNLYAQRKNGSEFPIEAGLSPVQTKDGLFVMTFLTDITERKQAEEEIKRLNESLARRADELETRYQQIVELAEEGVWVIDSEAKTTYVNHAMARMLGYTEEEMVGRSLFDFLHETEHPIVNTNLERRKQGVAEKHEFKLKTKDGKPRWTYMSTSPVLDENGKLLWSCALVYDITERKKAEEQLRESAERISLANAELARATRLKDEFLASMSHELRTPLNAILGLAEALQEEVYGSLTERQRRSIVTIEQSGKHLLELINDILDLSKIESGKMELQIAPVSVQSLCESSLTFIRQQAHHKNIRLSSEIAQDIGDIEVDERRIRQVLVNLLNNAVKFTPNGGEVRLEVEADSDAEILQFSVIDTGIGIAPENLDKLFKPFVQLDSSLSRRYAGTGLGLALVRRIVEVHGGSVSLESEVGKGSRFSVILPWKELNRESQSNRDNEHAIAELPKIHQALIVEDSDAAAKQVARYLAELSAAVVIHPTGEGTVEMAQRFEPDVIILDVLLPHLSGWEVLTQLKTNPATRHIPVLVISVVDERSQGVELGAADYLVKPISRPRFQAALRKIFASASEIPTHTALVVTPEERQQPPLILLAEDNEANISTLMDYLQVQGFQVNLARNGIEAVQMAKQQKPDLILMDIQMPEMDGLEATRRIRTEANLVTVPIIALTALAMPGDRERCLAAGANEYLTKPVVLKKLINLIAQHLEIEARG